MTPLLTPAEVAEMLQVSKAWVVRNAASIGGFKLGKAWRFRPEDVQRYVERQAQRRAA